MSAVLPTTEPSDAAPDSLFGLVRRAVFANYGAIAIALACSAVTLPVLLNKLGPEQYGAYALAIAWAMLLQLPFSGLEIGATRLASACVENNDFGELTCLVHVGVPLAFAASALISVACAIAILFIPAHLLPSSLRAIGPQFTSAIAFACLGVPVRSAGLILGGACRGLFRFRTLAKINAASSLFQAIGSIGIALAGGGLLGLMVFWCLVALPTAIAQAFVLERGIRGQHKTSAEARAVIRHVAKQSGWLGLENIFHGAAGEADKIIISIWRSAAEAGYYAVALRLPLTLLVLANEYASMFIPVAAAADVRGSRKELKKIFVRANSHILLFFVPAAAVLGIWADPLLDLWLGAVNAHAITPLFRWALVIVTIYCAQEIMQAVLYGLSKGRAAAGIAGLQMVIRIGAGLFLVRAFGATGMLGALLLSVIIGDTIIRTRILLRELKWSVLQVCRESLPTVLACAMLWVGLLAAHSFPRLVEQVAVGVLTFIAYGVLCRKISTTHAGNSTRAGLLVASR